MNGGRVLDIGCGNGAFLIAMQRRGFVAEGTEWSTQSAARVPRDAGVRVHVGDLLQLDLPEQSYDLITAWHVLEHMRDPDSAMAKIARLLKPAGTLMLAVPNVQSDQAMRHGLHWLHHDPPRHLFGFGPKSLDELLRRHGLAIRWFTTRSTEQNTFGEIQSRLNERGYPRDRLYDLLKGTSRVGFVAKAVDLTWLLILALPALVSSSHEARRGRGATLTAVAKVR